MITREEYKKKIELCDKLGAKKFQKIVLKAEELKFKLLKKVFPNFIVHYDKYCDKKRDKLLKKNTSQTKQKEIINECRKQKIAMRRELNREQNRNYHMDPNKPTEFLYYLNWNKKVHQKGLIRNAIILAALTITLSLGITPTLVVMGIAYETISAFINFQCINIQNSHIYRFKILEETLIKREQSRNRNNLANYSNAARVYARSIQETMDIPTIEQLIGNIKTKEEAAELRKMIESVSKSKQKSQTQQEKNEESSQTQKVTEDKRVFSSLEQRPTTISPSRDISEINTTTNMELERLLIEEKQDNQKLGKEAAIQKKIGGKK